MRITGRSWINWPDVDKQSRLSGGIVAHSVPENEWHETLNKARGPLKAIELAEEGA